MPWIDAFAEQVPPEQAQSLGHPPIVCGNSSAGWGDNSLSPLCTARSVEQAGKLRNTYHDFAAYVAVQRRGHCALKKSNCPPGLSSRGDVQLCLRRQANASRDLSPNPGWERRDPEHAGAMAAAQTTEWVSMRGALSSPRPVALSGETSSRTSGIVIYSEVPLAGSATPRSSDLSPMRSDTFSGACQSFQSSARSPRLPWGAPPVQNWRFTVGNQHGTNSKPPVNDSTRLSTLPRCKLVHDNDTVSTIIRRYRESLNLSQTRKHDDIGEWSFSTRGSTI